MIVPVIVLGGLAYVVWKNWGKAIHYDVPSSTSEQEKKKYGKSKPQS